MPPLQTTTEERPKRLQKEDYIYLSVVLVFFLLVLWVFSRVVSFHTKNINQVFSVSQAEPIKSLDMDQYMLIVRKLNLTIPQEDTRGIEAPSQQEQAKVPATEQKPAFDLSSVTVKVLNATSISGLAAKLADSLKRDGFTVVVTGNEDASQDGVIVSILESKKEYEQAIMASVRKLYPSATSKLQESNRGYDIIVTIGDK